MRIKNNKSKHFTKSKKYISLIEESFVYEVASVTPITEAINLSKKTGNKVCLKREDLQPIFSFKNRGSYNKIKHLNNTEKEKGVIAASAGNHAQGVASACQKLKIKCLIVMPETTPEIKIKAVKGFKASVILHGDNYDQALAHAKKLCKKENRTFIDPFDDPYTIAGQGTVGKEILDSGMDFDAIFVPVGGGGLLAGISAWISQKNKKTKIFGVEVDDSACLAAAMQAGKRVRLKSIGIFADGVAVAQVGKHNLEVIKECVDEVITVSIDEVCAGVKDIFEDTRVLSEPAGAVAVAGLKKYAARAKNKNLLAISSGANLNFDRISYIAERSELGEESEKILSIQIPEKSGSFLRLCKIFGKSQITEFNYRMSDSTIAQVLVGIKIKDLKTFTGLKERLTMKKFNFKDLTKNDISNDHLRYMVGGRKISTNNERLFRGEFPERPGALLDFLESLGNKWNISLFHYRNLGSAFGKVLVGIEDNSANNKKLLKHLHKTGYNFSEETNNIAYKQYLK